VRADNRAAAGAGRLHPLTGPPAARPGICSCWSTTTSTGSRAMHYFRHVRASAARRPPQGDWRLQAPVGLLTSYPRGARAGVIPVDERLRGDSW